MLDLKRGQPLSETRLPASEGLLVALACAALAGVHLALLTASFWHGFDLTDDAYYLYNLMYPRTETPFSGFAAMFSPVGSLFGHHLAGYRIFALILAVLASSWLALVTARLIETRLDVAVSWPLIAASAVLAASVHHAILPTLSYNDVYMLGVTLAAAGFARVLTGPLAGRALMGHGALVAFGTMCALHARSVTGLVLVTGICLVAIPAARALNLIGSVRQGAWFMASVIIGLVLAVAVAYLLGNPAALMRTQGLMLQEGGGTAFYMATILKGFITLGKYAAQHKLTLLVCVLATAVLFAAGGVMRRLAAVIPLALLAYGYWLAAETGAWRLITCAHFYAALLAGGLFVANIVAVAPQADRRVQGLLAFTLALMLLLLPLIASIGTSTDIAFHAVLNLGPAGLLTALPLAMGVAIRRDEAISQDGWSRPFTAAAALIIFGALAFTTYQLRQLHPYRLASPLREREVFALSAPPQLAGIMVARPSFEHLSKLNAFFAAEGETAQTARVLVLNQSPASVIASGLPALGPPWMFTHVPDTTFNCELVRLGLEGAPAKLYIVRNDEIREGMFNCLAAFGYGRPDQWRRRTCVPITPAKYSKPRDPESCIFETVRSGNVSTPKADP